MLFFRNKNKSNNKKTAETVHELKAFVSGKIILNVCLLSRIQMIFLKLFGIQVYRQCQRKRSSVIFNSYKIHNRVIQNYFYLYSSFGPRSSAML